MTRKLSVLFVLAFFVMSLGCAAFAAKATTATPNSAMNGGAHFFGAKEAKRAIADESNWDTQAYSKPPVAEERALGYYMLTDVQIGSTAFDVQSNMGQQREIAVGAFNRIHSVFMYRAYNTTSGRAIRYRGILNGVAQGTDDPISPLPTGNGGYPGMAMAPGDSLPIATFHYSPSTEDPRQRVIIGRQASLFSSTFGPWDYPADILVDPMPDAPNCAGIKTGMGTQEGPYIWPRIAGDIDGSGKAIAHVLVSESNGSVGTEVWYDTTGNQSLIYYRTPADAGAPPAFCGQLAYNVFIDSTTSGASYDIVADPGSGKVAAIYTLPKVWGNPGTDDFVYRESSNRGDSWGSRIQINEDWDPVDSIVLGDGRVAYESAAEMSALYDGSGCLHVLYNSWWQAPPNSYMMGPTRLYHWSSCTPTCWVMLKDGTTWGSESCNLIQNAVRMNKISLTQCTVASGPNAGTRLYAVYTMYPDSTGLDGNTYSDCSDADNGGPFVNGEVVVQASTDATGALWGAQVNVSNTRSDDCDSANCFSEGMTSTPPYVTEELKIQYQIDKDAGSYIFSSSGPQGLQTLNPMVVKTHPCYVDPLGVELATDPPDILWPFHTTPLGTTTVPVTLTATGNTPADYTRSVVYTPAGSWLAFAKPASSTVPVGCVQTLEDTLTATGPATEGAYKALVIWAYTGGKADTMRVELYNYAAGNWFVEDNGTIRTSTVKMTTNQTSRVGRMRPGGGWNYDADLGDTAYFYDGGLFLGKDSLSLSAGLFADTTPYGGGVAGHGDSLLGRLFCLSNLTIDSTGTYPYGYRHSSGVGCNKDSSIGIDADFYAPRHIDSANFMIGKFSLYAGPKDPGATINNVMVAYSADMDIPDDSADNIGGADPALKMVYQAGKWGANASRYGAMAGLCEDGSAAVGGTVIMNRRSIHRLSGYVHDSAWTWLKGMNTFTGTDSVGDLHSIVLLSRTATIKPKVNGVYTIYVIFAGQPKAGGSLAGLQAEIAKAKKFMCSNLSVNPALCVSCTGCGNANSDAAINISDAVYLIAFIFAGGNPPADCNYPKGMGDANGDTVINISDAVYLIAFIFAGGSIPHCQGM